MFCQKGQNQEDCLHQLNTVNGFISAQVASHPKDIETAPRNIQPDCRNHFSNPSSPSRLESEESKQSSLGRIDLKACLSINNVLLLGLRLFAGKCFGLSADMSQMSRRDFAEEELGNH
jgi:hypothetical protein